MAIETRQPLNHFRCIEDPEFQKELVDLGVIVQGELNPDRWRLQSSTAKTETSSKQLLEILSETPGIVVPLDQLTIRVYGEDSIYNRKLLSVMLTDTKKIIEDASSLQRVYGVGAGLGIERFHIAPRPLTFLYRASQDLGSFISFDDMSGAVYGCNDQRTVGETQHIARKLARDYLVGTNAQLDGAYIGDRRFVRLADRRFIPKYANKEKYVNYSDFPIHLQPAFQNWLLKYLRIPTAVGEDQLALKLPPQKWVAENRKFNEYELRIAEVLHRFPSVVIPAEKLAGYVLGDPLPEDWIETMQEHAGSMREKVKPGVKIYRFEEIGWSIGWSNIGLGRLKLRALSELWENFNNGVDGKQVAKRLYGNANGRSVENAQAIIQTLKTDLEETDYSIAFMHSLSKKSNFTPALIANHNIIGMDRKK